MHLSVLALIISLFSIYMFLPPTPLPSFLFLLLFCFVFFFFVTEMFIASYTLELKYIMDDALCDELIIEVSFLLKTKLSRQITVPLMLFFVTLPKKKTRKNQR